MFTTTLGEAAQFASRRFVRIALLPGLVFCFLLAVVASVAGERTPGAVLRAWKAQPVEAKTLLVMAFLIAVLFVAAFVDAAQSALLRCAEGYWGRAADRSLGRLGRRCHRLRLLGTADGAAQHLYPPRSRLHEVLPTRLGNILKAVELYPQMRYGIDAVLVWPRLFPPLPGQSLATLVTARAELSALLVRTHPLLHLRRTRSRLGGGPGRLARPPPRLSVGRRPARLGVLPGRTERRRCLRPARARGLRPAPRRPPGGARRGTPARKRSGNDGGGFASSGTGASPRITRARRPRARGRRPTSPARSGASPSRSPKWPSRPSSPPGSGEP